MPGTDVRESMRVVLGELPDLPFLPELPARGVGSDMTGRALGLLVDLHAEVQPSGWRVTAAAGRDERRSVSLLGEDLDALEEMAQGWSGSLKIQVCGPWTLAATVELHHGDKALADPGACRDLSVSLMEGVGALIADVQRRVPRANVVVQLDEPFLPAVLAGSVPTASGFGQLRAVDPDTVVAGLARVLQPLRDHALSVVHCCAASVPVGLLVRSGTTAVSLDLTAVGTRADDELGVALEGGTRLLLGVIDSVSSEPTKTNHPTSATDAPNLGGSSVLASTVAPVRALGSRLGLSDDAVAGFILTPTCGLAGASPNGAIEVLALAHSASRRLTEDPAGDLDG